MHWQALHDFWFGKLHDGQTDPAQRKRWFEVDREFDAECASRFESLLAPAAAGELDHWRNEPAACLSYIVLTDQLPRNIHRGTALAFDWDHHALQAARAGIERGFDVQLGWDERAFFYMPFEHSEVLLDQHLAVGLFTALRDAARQPPHSDLRSDLRSKMGNSLRFAQQHRDIILRFGRFPHRNAVLGRVSTAAEQEFLSDSDGFGQTPRS